ncbi:hypothetical protein Geob_3844 [Geotalea daltonii FRC-32]|uniref:Uncharacterized protein n=1 Tax=Geotalea daltonii (strain DSM 22248 / JCM 15807 / FRC-32) TaxID=316067 RepID=A0A068F6A1_GEODF|nr:hypothetical protein Geob_3844 [Geotalea daltonii FRC-32]
MFHMSASGCPSDCLSPSVQPAPSHQNNLLIPACYKIAAFRHLADGHIGTKYVLWCLITDLDAAHYVPIRLPICKSTGGGRL